MADITKINLNGTDLTIVDSAATSAIAGEIARAQGAESAITTALSAEVVARQSADTALETAISGKADTATTLSGYGITDAWTSAQTQSAITSATSGLQETLTAGAGIAISSANVISCTVDTGLYVVVQSLPAQPAAGNENKIHLVPLASTAQSQNDQYEEYLWDGTDWEYLGTKSVEVDLSDYWTSAQTQSAITSALTDYYTSAQTESAATEIAEGMVGANLNAYDTVEQVLSEAGIASYDNQEETYVVNAMASEDYVDGSVGIDILESEWASVEGVLEEAGIASYDVGKEEYVVNAMATADLLDSTVDEIWGTLSGITASYSAATETLILNIPTGE